MGKFVVKQSSMGYSFRLKAQNGEIIGVSEVYSGLQGCRSGIESVCKAAPAAAVEDQTLEGYLEEKNPKFEIYLDKKQAFRFRLKARNGEVILASEAYTAKASCRGGIESVRKNVQDAPVLVEE